MEKIVITKDIRDLTGTGEEFLLDRDGNPIARFYNGMLSSDTDEQEHSEEITLPQAA